MQPQSETTPDTNQPSGAPQNWQSPPNTPNRPNKKKILIILAAALVVIVIGAAIIKAVSHKDTKSTGNITGDENIYHMRAGYNIKDYGSDIGDPLALTMGKAGKPLTTSKGSVIFACNVMTITDINSQKIYLDPRADGKAVTRNYIDGVGQQTVETEDYSVNDGDKGNSCMYSLQSGGLLEFDVYQPPYTTTSAIQDQISRNFIKTDDNGGLATYRDKDNDETLAGYMLVSGNDAVEVKFNGTKLTQAQEKTILGMAAKNFADQQKNSKGAAIAAYDTPTLKKPYAMACDLVSNADIKSLTGSDASVYAEEGLSSATGVEKVNGNLYTYLTTTCSRFNADLGSGIGAGAFDQKLDVTVTSFSSTEPAKHTMEQTAKSVKNKTDATIGDEGFGYTDSVGQNTILFRQGRFIVELVFDRTLQKKAGLQDVMAMTQKLTPFAQQTAAKLKTMQ